MRIYIDWKYNAKLDKWIIAVYRNRIFVALVIRQDEESCKQWAEANMRLFMQGKQPQYI